MKKFLILLLLSFYCLQKAFSISISPQDASKIGEKIWKNECSGTLEGLTCWNKGEKFASMGIGHFIWYTANHKEHFEETFPALLTFLDKESACLPSWLKTATGCPWQSREDFYQNIQSVKMTALRQLLFDTKNLQAIFIVNRFEKVLPKMLEYSSQKSHKRIITIFHRLSQDANGLYALIDYFNFKGSGISSAETYKGQGWGLLQVLERIPTTSTTPLLDFVKAAKMTLEQRVQNAPPEKREERWLKGWFKRLDTYLTPVYS